MRNAVSAYPISAATDCNSESSSPRASSTTPAGLPPAGSELNAVSRRMSREVAMSTIFVRCRPSGEETSRDCGPRSSNWTASGTNRPHGVVGADMSNDTHTDDALFALVAEGKQGVLATVKRDGRPQLSNIIYRWDDESKTASVSVTADRAKSRNALRDPRVSLHVSAPDFLELRRDRRTCCGDTRSGRSSR